MKTNRYKNEKKKLLLSTLAGLFIFSSYAQASIVTCEDDRSDKVTLEAFAGNAKSQVLRTYFAWGNGPDSVYVRTNTKTQEGVLIETYTLLNSIFQNPTKVRHIKYKGAPGSSDFKIQLGTTVYNCSQD